MKIILTIILILATLYGLMWLIGMRRFPVQYGVSFNQNHAASLGLDWRENYEAMLRDLRPSSVRIAAMWSSVEKTQGNYDFTDVDWMMDKAAEYNATVLLVVGQKAPRWPECYVPEWVQTEESDQATASLFAYVTEVVQRYKQHPALEFWQVENEAYIRFAFGECEGFRRAVVPAEIDLVRTLDPTHRIVMTDSGELATWRRPSWYGDILGTTLYRVVRAPNGTTFNYDWLPAGFYYLKSRMWGKGYENFFVAELQAEPWFDKSTPLDTPIDVQEETMNPNRMRKHIDYAQRVGASRVYLWGVEWWYFMKEKAGDTRYWDIAKETFAK